MAIRVAEALSLVLAAAMITPAAAEDRLDIPLSTLGVNHGANTTLSFGKVGLDSRAGNSYRPAPGEDPYYFMIPSQRPATGASGVLLRIPFGNSASHQPRP